MTLSNKQRIFTRNIALLIQYAYSIGYEGVLAEVARTDYQQKRYVELGLSKTLNSQHKKRLAGDIFFFKIGGKKVIENKEELQPIGDFWESLHSANKWGGNWKSFYDSPHYEMKG